MWENRSRADKIFVNFVDAESKSRAELMRIGLSLGYHCEIYADFDELAAYPPRSGIIIVRDQPELYSIAAVLHRLFVLGISLPVVAMGKDPTSSRVVRAIKEGALDYLVLPLAPVRLSACLSKVRVEAAQISESRQRCIEVQSRLALLSPREREVLDAVASGKANKEIARDLQISHRTVEIHRANMMEKIGAQHSADAIRLQIEAGAVPVPFTWREGV